MAVLLLSFNFNKVPRLYSLRYRRLTSSYYIRPSMSIGLVGGASRRPSTRSKRRPKAPKLVHVIRLLICSLYSDTVFTDTFLAEREQSKSSEIGPRIVTRQNCQTSSSSSSNAKIKMKLYIDKKDKKKFEGNSHISCYNNLYKSVLNLDEASCVEERSRKFLINPMLPEHLFYPNQLIKFPAQAPEDRFYMCRTLDCQSTHLSLIANVKCQCGVITNKRMKLIDSSFGIVKRASYMVTDDLVVTLPSMSLIILYMIRAREGVEEIDVTVGEDEALALLQASMISKTVLTDAFIAKQNQPEVKLSINS